MTNNPSEITPEPMEEESPYTEIQRRIMHQVLRPWADRISSPTLPELKITFFQRDMLIWSIEEFLRAEKEKVVKEAYDHAADVVDSYSGLSAFPICMGDLAKEIRRLKEG